ncbi:hypothetical protein DTL42_24815 [Bremerella cremea]|uniref:Hydrazine synthase alpha subunit middle domain-containing protein n=1 Tax=Bremerella cremea TaxID=1031537 RepID=A0A368KJ45_9BACT|nr:hypothetical protein [Bremerella cremea]RCS40596.1 hypothetical protein DTL42_24815 [Bremerella cremea]
MPNRFKITRWGLPLVVVLAACVYWLPGWSSYPQPNPELTQFVSHAPKLPIVFTSRTQAASLRAAADSGEEFIYPGKRLWQASEGRLRLLTPAGQVSELTWGKRLPDGSTLIDVMSPSISPDGTKIVFAGRKAEPDPGHFRLYEIGLDGQGLRQLTGNQGDPGCTQVPPLRYASDGKTLLSDEERRSIDFDDIDPTYAPGGHIIFASSRTPDLGRGHARRSTTLWIMKEDGSEKKPLSANRNNDRWPWIADNGYVIFSLWSRNQEVVSADRHDIVAYQPGMQPTTLPTDAWIAAHIEPNADYFGTILKLREPVWRTRTLMNGNYAFMTPLENQPPQESDRRRLTIAQAAPGSVTNAPSSLHSGDTLPESFTELVTWGPHRDSEGKELELACPSPCPPNKLVFAAATFDEAGQRDDRRFGLAMADDQWPTHANGSVTAKEINFTELFNDPNFVDAEPVAVYPREIDYHYVSLEQSNHVATIELASGESVTGPTATVRNSDIFRQNNQDAPGQTTRFTSATTPTFPAPPEDLIEMIRIYASHRDRFDDPDNPRVKGGLELILETPVKQRAFEIRVPCGAPTVLAGFDHDGKVALWPGHSNESSEQRSRFLAFAGDHYSGARPGFTHSCTGCHTGHSGTPTLRLPAQQ